MAHVERVRLFDHATATSVLLRSSLCLALQAFVDVVSDAMGVSASVTFTDARLLAGGAVPDAPPVVVRLDGFFAVPAVTFLGVGVAARLELGASRMGPRPLPLGDTAHPVALLDGAVLPWAGIAQVALQSLNLLDARVADGVFVSASRFGEADRRAPTRHITAGSPRQLQSSVVFSW